MPTIPNDTPPFANGGFYQTESAVLKYVSPTVFMSTINQLEGLPTRTKNSDNPVCGRDGLYATAVSCTATKVGSPDITSDSAAIVQGPFATIGYKRYPGAFFTTPLGYIGPLDSVDFTQMGGCAVIPSSGLYFISCHARPGGYIDDGGGYIASSAGTYVVGSSDRVERYNVVDTIMFGGKVWDAISSSYVDYVPAGPFTYSWTRLSGWANWNANALIDINDTDPANPDFSIEVTVPAPPDNDATPFTIPPLYAKTVFSCQITNTADGRVFTVRLVVVLAMEINVLINTAAANFPHRGGYRALGAYQARQRVLPWASTVYATDTQTVEIQSKLVAFTQFYFDDRTNGLNNITINSVEIVPLGENSGCNLGNGSITMNSTVSANFATTPAGDMLEDGWASIVVSHTITLVETLEFWQNGWEYFMPLVTFTFDYNDPGAFSTPRVQGGSQHTTRTVAFPPYLVMFTRNP